MYGDETMLMFLNFILDSIILSGMRSSAKHTHTHIHIHSLSHLSQLCPLSG